MKFPICHTVRIQPCLSTYRPNAPATLGIGSQCGPSGWGSLHAGVWLYGAGSGSLCTPPQGCPAAPPAPAQSGTTYGGAHPMVRGGGLGLVECQPVEQGLSQRTRGSGPGVRAPKRAFPRGKGWGYGGDCRCCHFTLRSSAPQGNRRTVSGASMGGRGGFIRKATNHETPA